MLINRTSAASRPKVGSGGAPIPKIGGGSGNLLAAAARRGRACSTELSTKHVLMEQFESPDARPEVPR